MCMLFIYVHDMNKLNCQTGDDCDYSVLCRDLHTNQKSSDLKSLDMAKSNYKWLLIGS